MATAAVHPNPAAASSLWAHLLNKDHQTPPLKGIPLPPLAPIDKTATSMRILLHDTQANFEKFSARIDDMVASVGDARREIVTVKQMFVEERDSLLNDIYTTLNRSQCQIQASLGEPAQASKLSDVCLRIDNLDKRLDGIHSLQQSFSQILQNQSHILQSLQTQQNTIAAAVLPLLPSVQGISVLLDKCTTEISGEIKKLPITISAKHATSSPHVIIPALSVESAACAPQVLSAPAHCSPRSRCSSINRTSLKRPFFIPNTIDGSPDPATPCKRPHTIANKSSARSMITEKPAGTAQRSIRMDTIKFPLQRPLLDISNPLISSPSREELSKNICPLVLPLAQLPPSHKTIPSPPLSMHTRINLQRANTQFFKQRKTPTREGRRFIPLDDLDSESDSE